jgi:hypothetical protein
MPESNAAKTRRLQKQNRANGIGDEQGRIVRVKDPPKIIKCTICNHELKVTKTNTEIIAHASSKHNVSNIDECFPGATQLAQELITAIAPKSGAGAAGSSSKTSTTNNKKSQTATDDLLSAGLAAGKKSVKR